MKTLLSLASSRLRRTAAAVRAALPAQILNGLLLLSVTPAFGDGGMTITINNNTTRNLLVTVYDRNTHPAQKIVSNQTINGFASISVTVATDESGLGHLSWTAVTADPDMRMCGRHDKPGLNDRDTVHVYANTECRAE
jgi:hypothetical protein